MNKFFESKLFLALIVLMMIIASIVLSTREACAVEDTVPPCVSPLTCTIISPVEGATISGNAFRTIPVKLNLADNISLGRVEIFLQHKVTGQLFPETPVAQILSGKTASLTLNVDTTDVPNGPYNILALIYDSAGNTDYKMTSVSLNYYTPDPGVSQWFKETARPISTGEAVGSSVKTDITGNTVIVGNFKGNVNFGGLSRTALGGSDIFIQKFGQSKNLLWYKTFGGTSDDSVTSVAIDSTGNIYITGYFSGTTNLGGTTLTSGNGIFGSDIFVAKYSSSGTHIWSKRFGGTAGNNSGAAIAIDPSSNVIVAGKIYTEANLGAGSITTRAGSADGFILKLTGLGNYIWAKDFGGVDSDTVKGIAVDSAGDVVVVGFSYAGIDFGSGLIANVGSSDLFMAKYAGSDGHYLWSRVAGGTGPDTAEGVAIDRNNNIFIAGSYFSTMVLGGTQMSAPIDSGIYLAKYNNAGDIQWAKSVAHETTSGGIIVRGVAVDSNGNVAITGNASGGVNFGSGQAIYGDANIYVAKYGPQGKYLWAKRSSNLGRCAGYAITTDKDRNVISTGFIQGDVNIDGLLAASPGQQIKSTFVLKVSK